MSDLAGLLRGTADFIDAVRDAYREQRTGFSDRESGDYLDAAGLTGESEFMDLGEFLNTASDDELAAMADQHVVDAEVHCEGCKCPTICGCGREIYAEYDRPGSPPLWFHCDDDSPITLQCARIPLAEPTVDELAEVAVQRNVLHVIPDPAETVRVSPDARPADFDAVSAACRAVMEWVDRPDNDAALIGCTPSMVAGVAVNAYRAALLSVAQEDLAAHVAGSIRHFRLYRAGNFEDAADDIARDLICEYRVTKR